MKNGQKQTPSGIERIVEALWINLSELARGLCISQSLTSRLKNRPSGRIPLLNEMLAELESAARKERLCEIGGVESWFPLEPVTPEEQARGGAICRALRKKLRLSRNSFGNIWGVRGAAIDSWEKGRLKIHPLYLSLMCRWRRAERFRYTEERDLSFLPKKARARAESVLDFGAHIRRTCKKLGLNYKNAAALLGEDYKNFYRWATDRDRPRPERRHGLINLEANLRRARATAQMRVVVLKVHNIPNTISVKRVRMQLALSQENFAFELGIATTLLRQYERRGGGLSMMDRGILKWHSAHLPRRDPSILFILRRPYAPLEYRFAGQLILPGLLVKCLEEKFGKGAVGRIVQVTKASQATVRRWSQGVPSPNFYQIKAMVELLAA